MIDHEAMCDEIGNFDALARDQVHLARRTVCHFAHDADDATLLMKMLGLHPSQEEETCSPLPPRNENTRSPSEAFSKKNSAFSLPQR